MRIAPASLQNNYSNLKNKANASFGMNLSRTGQITIDLAKAEKAIPLELYNTLKYLHLINPNPAPLTDDILLGLERFDGPEGALVATLGTKDARHFISQNFAPNSFNDAFHWAINQNTIKELRGKQ